MSAEEDLIDYSDDELQQNDAVATGADGAVANGEQQKGDLTVTGGDKSKGSYVGIHSTGFRDFLLKPELLRAITDCGFEHPSEVQQVCIPQAILGVDILCQAKSGLGKTAVFVLATLQQIEPVPGETSVLVMCHTRELAFQIKNEFARFSKYMPDVKIAAFFGGVNIEEDKKIIKNKDTHPHIVIATPGRLCALVRDGTLYLKTVLRFVLDECDKMLEQTDMRRDVQEVFRATPTQKQVMMFSATMPVDIREKCKIYMRNQLEIFVDDEKKLTLHGLQQYFIKVGEAEKNRKLNDLLDLIEFNQCIIFVKSTLRATALDKLLKECGFPSVTIHSGVSQEERITRFKDYKDFKYRICVSTDVFGRGIDIERINLALNYDLPADADSYLHRVGRAGRFGTKGLAVSFVSTEADQEVLKAVEKRFEVELPEFPEGGIDRDTYMAQ